ncbi:fungal trichothecene efflux pump [Xylariales sp. PMI_506]|nr:fungal trichothecene efflux pump [Xylariales sp. PMI_506]
MANSVKEASGVEHQEDVAEATSFDQDDTTGKVFAVDDFELPKGYFRSIRFCGSMCAIGLSLMSGVAGFSFIAPILAEINADIGPSPDLNWVAWTYTLTSAVGMMVVGRVTDIFGRRWFFIVGSAIALLGSIICAIAQNIPTLIAGETLIGLACSSQLSFAFASAELVPQKYRFLALGFCYTWLIPPNGFGAIIATAFVYESTVGWRGVFYVLSALNAAATACWFFFYFPPSFNMKHGLGSRRKYLKEFDYIGTLLATLGLLLFLMGLSWGGTQYPWKSAHVITCIMIGFLLLVGFFTYEVYVPLKEPLLPMGLCKNRTWVLITFIWAVDASVYYAFAIIWPDMVNELYADGQNLWAGWASCVVTGGITIGMVSAGFLTKRVHWVLRCCFFIGSVFLAAMATCTPETPTRAIVLLLIGCIFVGVVECIAATISSLCLDDQREIGTALGLGGSCRSFVSTLGETVYDVILANRLAHTIPEEVPKALAAAGLPPGSTSAFLVAYSEGTQAAFDAVPGLNSTILAVGTAAYKTASADAYRTVFYSTIAFSAVGLLLTLFIPNIDDRLTGKVTITLHERANEQSFVSKLEEETIAGAP